MKAEGKLSTVPREESWMVVIDILKATQQLHPRCGPKYHTKGANVPIGGGVHTSSIAVKILLGGSAERKEWTPGAVHNGGRGHGQGLSYIKQCARARWVVNKVLVSMEGKL